MRRTQSPKQSPEPRAYREALEEKHLEQSEIGKFLKCCASI